MITNTQSGTTIDEIETGVFRISTPVPPPQSPVGFSFNQYLLVDEEPLLFHTGPRGMFELTREAINKVMPAEKLRWVGFSHWENDESGALGKFLAIAPRAQPLCSSVNAMINADAMDRPPRALAEGDVVSLGQKKVRWFETPHLPHAWECGYLMEETTRTFLCGDFFTQPGHKNVALSQGGDILGPSESFRKEMDYFAHGPRDTANIERLAATNPRTLACMHGSAWRGDGAALLRELAKSLAAR